MTAQSGLNERTRRRWAAVEARALGRGGIARVAEATGLSRTTIGAGLRELAEGREDEDASGRLRNPGAGRKSLPVYDAGLVVALEKLVDPATRGDPMGPLRWTCSRSPGAEPPLPLLDPRRRSGWRAVTGRALNVSRGEPGATCRRQASGRSASGPASRGSRGGPATRRSTHGRDAGLREDDRWPVSSPPGPGCYRGTPHAGPATHAGNRA